MIGTQTRMASVLCLLLILTGCSGFRLHSEAREKQGVKAAEAWKTVDLDAYFESHRVHRKDLLARELDAVNQHHQAIQENELRLLGEETVADFDNRLNQELERLVGSGRAQLADWDDQLRTVTAAKSAQGDARDRLIAHKQKPLSCTQARIATVPDAAAEALRSLNQTCDEERQAIEKLDEIYESIDGTVGLEWQAIGVLRKEIETLKSEAQRRSARYRTAKADYEGVVKANLQGKTPSEKVKTSAKVLRESLEELLALRDAFAREEQSSERLNTLNTLLESIEKGDDPGQEASNKEVIALMMPKIADDISAIRALKDTLPKSALLIQRDLEKAREARAKLAVKVQEHHLALSQATLTSQMFEAFMIDRAIAALAKVQQASQFAGESLYAAARMKLPKTERTFDLRFSLYDAVSRYLEAIGHQRAHTASLRVLRQALTHERAIDTAEINARQWTTLVNTFVSQAEQFAAGGQKAADYQSLLQALSLIWIGIGVNQ